MNYVVQPFEYFGEDPYGQLPKEVYMRELGTLELIETIWNHVRPNRAIPRDRALKEVCASYHGSAGGEYGFSFYPKEITITVSIFEKVKWKDKEEDIDSWDKTPSGVWPGHCDLIIKLKHKEFLKLLDIIYGKN